MMRSFAAGVLILLAGEIGSVAWAENSALELRTVPKAGRVEKERGVPVPREAVRAFVYAGEPKAVKVTADRIAVDYGANGALFERSSGKLVRLYTVVDGYPAQRPEEFPPVPRREELKKELVGPGVLETRGRVPPAQQAAVMSAVEIDFGGRHFRAMQPTYFLDRLRDRVGRNSSLQEVNAAFGDWTKILTLLNSEAYLEAQAGGGAEAVRYGMKEGLPSNIVTHMAVAEGKLFAACADIYDPEKQAWGPGGLACLEPEGKRFVRVDKVKDLPVRFVTLMQTVGDDLWIGFRTGEGVEGNMYNFGMGVYAGHYRPKTTAIVLARLSKGEWTVFSRPPVPAPQPKAPIRTPPAPLAPPEASHEVPFTLTLRGDDAFLFTDMGHFQGGSPTPDRKGFVSICHLPTNTWSVTDVRKDFGARRLNELVADSGEVLVFSDRGAHRYRPAEKSWAYLDPQTPLQNPNVSAMVRVGDELWIGTTNQSFGVVGQQGLARLNTKTLQWTYETPEKIGTGCPVRAIAPSPDGDVYVLFAQRPWMGAAAEILSADDRDHTIPGLGRYHAGQWTFPVKVADTARFGQLAAAGGKVFLLSGLKLYSGPNPWKMVLDLAKLPSGNVPPSSDGVFDSRTTVLRPTFDRQKLQIIYPASDHPEAMTTILFDPAAFTAGAPTTQPPNLYERYNYVFSVGRRLKGPRGAGLTNNWALIPVAYGDDVSTTALGDLSAGGTREVFDTPEAIYLVSPGEILRLDRKLLPKAPGESQ